MTKSKWFGIIVAVLAISTISVASYPNTALAQPNDNSFKWLSDFVDNRIAIYFDENPLGNGLISFWDAIEDQQDQIDMLRVGTGVEGDLVPYWDFNNVIEDLEENDAYNKMHVERLYVQLDEQNTLIADLYQRLQGLENKG